MICVCNLDFSDIEDTGYDAVIRLSFGATSRRSILIVCAFIHGQARGLLRRRIKKNRAKKEVAMKAFWFWPIMLTICLQLCFVFNTEAKMETITHTVRQPFAGSQSPDDARVAAMAKAKREALERAGTYIESLTVVKDHVVEKDEILALTGGVLEAVIVSQKNYATEDTFGVVVVAKVDVDTSVLEKRVKKLLQDRTLLEKHRESRQREGRQREGELLAKVERLEAENGRLQTLSAEGQEQKKTELKEQFHDAIQALTAVEWNQKILALWRDGKYTNPKEAIEYLDQAIRLDRVLLRTMTRPLDSTRNMPTPTTTGALPTGN